MKLIDKIVKEMIEEHKGGDVSIFKDLIKDPEFTVYYLENNYRNKKAIIDVATKVINQVKSKIAKKCNIVSEGIGVVEVNNKCHIRDYLRNIRKEENYRDWFILTRSNKEIHELSEILESMDIPFMSFKRAGMTFDQMTELMQEDTVKLLTVHVSKGLENKNVLLYGNFQVVVPSYRQNEDERKVMYVGITRAEEKLVILN